MTEAGSVTVADDVSRHKKKKKKKESWLASAADLPGLMCVRPGAAVTSAKHRERPPHELNAPVPAHPVHFLHFALADDALRLEQLRLSKMNGDSARCRATRFSGQEKFCSPRVMANRHAEFEPRDQENEFWREWASSCHAVEATACAAVIYVS